MHCSLLLVGYPRAHVVLDTMDRLLVISCYPVGHPVGHPVEWLLLRYLVTTEVSNAMHHILLVQCNTLHPLLYIPPASMDIHPSAVVLPCAVSCYE